MKKISRIAAFFTASVMTICLATSLNSETIKAAETTPGTMREITTMNLVKEMGIGWNLGNTLEACGDWINKSSIQNFETAWGSPVITKAMIDGVHNSGFNSIRIPVAWSNLMAADYTINADLLNRVEEVVNYALADNMYVVLNIHWDSGWFSGFSTKYDECMKKYKSIWTQISTRFAKYGDHLIFESLNEEGCYDDIWNRYSGSTTGKDKAYGILNNINQAFVDLIRGSAGNNNKRHLLIAGYGTDIGLTCDPLYKMPIDPQKRCAVSVHYYTPSTFAILEKDADWGKATTTWGTDAERQELTNNMAMMKRNFVDKGIPVIVGEYGVAHKNKTPEMVRLYLTSVCKEAYKMGLCPMLWDISGGQYDRTTCKFIDPELANQLRAIPTPIVEDVIYGDLNNDKSLNIMDYILMKKYILGTNTNINLKATDLNGDGTINIFDSILLKKYLLGQITKFPVQN